MKSERSESGGFTLIKASTLLEGQEDETQWLWDGILPQGGMSLLVSRPKVGKTTLGMNLAVNVARGEDFLERPTLQATVLYLALEPKRSETLETLRALGITEEEPLYFHFGRAPDNAIERGVVAQIVQETGAGLVICDVFQKLARVKDMNDYAEVSLKLEPLLHVAREYNSHIMLLHHANQRQGKGDPVDAVLGSTALAGEVDTIVTLKKKQDGSRTIATIQRYADDLEETALVIRPDQSLILAGSHEESKKRDLWGKIQPFLEKNQGSGEAAIIDAVKARRADVRAALRWALKQSPPLCMRVGGGRRDDPFIYFAF